MLALELKNGNFLIAPKEYSYKLRCRPLLDEEIMILKDVNTEVFKEKIEAIDETYKVSEDILSDIKAMCLKVYSGDSFDDETYNKLISYVQTAVTS